MRPVDNRSVDFRERVPTGSAKRRLLIPPVLNQKAWISTAQGCQLHAVILAKKRSRSSNWRMFITSPCTKTNVSLFSMPLREYSIQTPVLSGFIHMNQHLRGPNSFACHPVLKIHHSDNLIIPTDYFFFDLWVIKSYFQRIRLLSSSIAGTSIT